jgi:hypothetical protein
MPGRAAALILLRVMSHSARSSLRGLARIAVVAALALTGCAPATHGGDTIAGEWSDGSEYPTTWTWELQRVDD